MPDNKHAQLFYNWNEIKIKIHFKKRERYFKQGEIWWCNLGQNIGTEINGKEKFFSRPILIYRKLSKDSFLAIPLSTQIKDGSWYIKMTAGNEACIAVLSQIKIMSPFRLISKIGKIDKAEYEEVKAGMKELYVESLEI